MAEHKFVNFSQLYHLDYKDLKKWTALTPPQIYDLCVKYFKWAENNPLSTPETAAFQGQVYQGKSAKIRPFSITSLCLFLGVPSKTWRDWRNGDNEDYRAVVEWADAIIREQKTTGAMVGVFNAAFMIKDLDMDNSTVKTVGDPDQPVHHSVKSENKIEIDEETLKNLLDKI